MLNFIKVWLLINGSCTLLLAATIILYKYCKCRLFLGMLIFFLIIWLQRGTYIVLTIDDKLDLVNKQSKFYCNFVFLIVSIATIAYTWTTVAFFVLFSTIYTLFQSFFKTTNYPDIYNVIRSP